MNVNYTLVSCFHLRKRHLAFHLLLVGLFACGWSCSTQTANNSSDKPDETRFTVVPVTPAGSLDEPMMFEVLNDESVILIERGGLVKKWDAASGIMSVLRKLAVFTGSEQGLVGLTLDPNFDQNHWLYLYYAPLDEDHFLLTRWELQGDSLPISSRKILLTIPSDREETSHTGGGMTWDAAGNLYLTVGNNTGNSLYSQTDERPNRISFDDQRGASNTNDWRGKILRIHPEADGTYTIPSGNLFPKGTEKTKPEIYVMGNRNPWRVSVDSQTGYLYWGEIGPDADADSENGPMGYDELNQAKGPGFFGWPYFIGENHAYPMYDYITGTLGDRQDPAKPLNQSRNNTGRAELPPAHPAFVSYPYRPSEKFPLVGSSSRCAIGGPIFHRQDFKKATRLFPTYYEGKWLAADLSRFWIMAITMDEQGNYRKMERFAPDYHPRQPIDIKFGPTGDLYVLEYGGNTANSHLESHLARIEYNAGNRKPQVELSVDREGGTLPLSLQLSANGTRDFDGDAMRYQWTLTSQTVRLEAEGENTSVTLTKLGVYDIVLNVTDAAGQMGSASTRVVAGNSPPEVDIVMKGNQTFFFENKAYPYQVMVVDREDGSLAGSVDGRQVSFSIDYVSEGFDYAAVMAKYRDKGRFAVPIGLMAQSDCRTCHNPEQPGVGPSFREVSERYRNDKQAAKMLAHKIINGSNGVWGRETAMPAHPTISNANAQLLADYILHQFDAPVLPLTGTWKPTFPAGDNLRGSFVIRAAYSDRGHDDLPSLFHEKVLIRRSPRFLPVMAEIQQGVIRDQLDEYTFLTARPESFIAFKGVDLTDVEGVSVQPNWHLYDIYAGGTIEVRIDSVKGRLLGVAEMTPRQFNVRYRGAFAPPPGSAEKGVQQDASLPPLDLSKFFGPGSDKSLFTLPSVVKWNDPPTGVHSLYFVFRKDGVSAETSLFPLAYIDFIPEK